MTPRSSQASPVTVHKFGGAALASASAIVRAAAILCAARGRRVVTTSALAGVTDALLDIGRAAAATNLDAATRDSRELRDRHLRVLAEVNPNDTQARDFIIEQMRDLQQLCAKIALEESLPPSRSDEVICRGERMAAEIFASALRATRHAATVIDPVRFLQTDGRFGDAAPDIDRTKPAAVNEILPVLARGEIAVIPGFIASDADGRVVTLGRGGTDLTATVLARSLDAVEVTLWKDVPGFLTADPRIVTAARVVARLDPREASELAYYGAKVLHPRALIPLTGTTVLRIRPFADPDAPGTEIAVGKAVAGSPVRAISAMTSQALVTVAGNGMLGVPGIAARTFSALAASSISVSLITQASSEHSICFTVPEHAAAAAAAELRRAFAQELERGEIDSVDVELGVATVAVVGIGMARVPGTAARVLTAIADAKVNVIAIAQGSSERNISFVVESSSVAGAVRSIHRAFHLDKVGGGRVARRHGADVIMLGCGRIGRELISQIAALPTNNRAALRIVAVLDRSGFHFAQRGLSTKRLAAICAAKKSGKHLGDLPGGKRGSPLESISHLAAHAITRPVVVDVSSGDTRDALLSAITHGMDLVLANKVPLASDSASAHALLRDARANGRTVLHEATVGAGLPIIDTVEKLIASGDRILSILACPSGTLGYLLSELAAGKRFSECLKRAMKLGYTEPDPREDLSGCDVARKAIILGRLLGYTGELSDIAVESLVPETMRDIPLAQFLVQASSLDEIWSARVNEARQQNKVLRYCAIVTRTSIRVGLIGAPANSSLGSLSGTDNQFVFTTARYRDNALVISGPGAGPAVTAAGVLSDLQRVVS